MDHAKVDVVIKETTDEGNKGGTVCILFTDYKEARNIYQSSKKVLSKANSAFKFHDGNMKIHNNSLDSTVMVSFVKYKGETDERTFYRFAGLNFSKVLYSYESIKKVSILHVKYFMSRIRLRNISCDLQDRLQVFK